MSRTQRAEAQTSERSTALGPDKQGTESCISARQLCDGCSVILSAPGTTASNSGSVELFLESLLYIRGTNCGFCQLVRDAVFEELRLDPTLELNPRSSFKLQWHDTAAPGGRAGFKILGLRSAWIGFGDERKTSSRQLQTDTRRVYIKARLQPVLNIQQVSGWINHCTANHKACLARQDRTFQELFPGLQVLRLIDVQNDCLVETPPASERYVALSYVWGEIRDFTLTQANRQELMQPGTMSKVWKNIPVTIKDAIDLVRTLGLRDLWVDCICLMQNDAEDLNRGLEVMDRIFAQAWFTLVAACGHDANAGLPGVRPGRRKEQILLNMVAPGVSLGVFFGPDAYLRQSIYETRAWTFQVHVISGRILYFVDNQVFFRCQQAKYLETCEDHPNLAITSYLSEGTTRYPLGINQTDHPLGSYSDMLTQYTRRTLKNQSDILWDMAGVMRRFSEKLGSPTIQGMPACALGRSLLFTGQNLHRRNGFPSYSWAGWQGKIQFPAVQRSGEGLELVEWIDWYETPGSGRTSILVLEGPRDIDHTSLLFTCQGLPPDAHAHRRVCKGFDSTSGESMSYPLLSFWTVAIILQVKIFDVFHGYGRLIGKDGVTCGAMVLDQPLPGTESLSAEPFEFVLLSEGSSQLPGAPELDNSLQGTCGYYHVILVVWEGGVAERRGVGTIAKEAIAKGFGDGAIWKEIALG
ncbi:HET-domain-containing protein [Podospora australis]|uniref:HET-domain-containing protein n=1 Tax=Podospora australis TaxID=1536484 RepID=A0AAN7ACW4_9PEZI|nr:HET-domain-containing protein [Podospora australis]